MNAMEARKLSKENLPKLVQTNVSAAKALINIQIAEAVKSGEFSARLPINLPVTIHNEAIEQLALHFESLGYKVEIHNLFISKMFQVSWPEEE